MKCNSLKPSKPVKTPASSPREFSWVRNEMLARSPLAGRRVNRLHCCPVPQVVYNHLFMITWFLHLLFTTRCLWTLSPVRPLLCKHKIPLLWARDLRLFGKRFHLIESGQGPFAAWNFKGINLSELAIRVDIPFIDPTTTLHKRKTHTLQHWVLV